MNLIWFMINVLFIFSMFRCLLRESLWFSLPAFWLIFCEAQCTRNWRENQIKDFLRALSILFVFHAALALCLDSDSWGEEEKHFFLDIIKFAQKRVWLCSSMLCINIMPTHHTDAVSFSLTRFCLHHGTYWPKFAPKSERRSSSS